MVGESKRHDDHKGNKRADDDCEKCGVHMAWEERMKLLESIPGLLTWMNHSKGSIRVICVVITLAIPILFTLLVSTRNEVFTKLREHEDTIEKRQDRMAEQVLSISRDAAAIRMDVAVMIRASDLNHKEIDKELLALKEFHKSKP